MFGSHPPNGQMNYNFTLRPQKILRRLVRLLRSPLMQRETSRPEFLQRIGRLPFEWPLILQ